MIKNLIKNTYKHIIGMMILVIIIGIYLYTQLIGLQDFSFIMTMFGIANVLGLIFGYFIEVIQRVYDVGTASKKDMYATIIGGNIGAIIITLWVILW